MFNTVASWTWFHLLSLGIKSCYSSDFDRCLVCVANYYLFGFKLPPFWQQ